MSGEPPTFPASSWEGATVEAFMITDARRRPPRRPWRCWFRAHVWEFAWWGPALMRDGDTMHMGECCWRCGKVRIHRLPEAGR